MYLEIIKNLYKKYFIKENASKILVVLWLLNSFFLTLSRFFLHRIGVGEGPAKETILFAVSLIPIIVLIKFYKEDRAILKDSRLFFIIFGLAILSFLIGYILHPEYGYFFSRKEYGLLRVFRPDSAIYALLFFCLIDKAEDLYQVLKYFSYFKFFELMVFNYLPRLLKGYWLDINHVGAKVTRLYSLSFGYSLIAVVVIFLFVFYKERKIWDFVLSVVSMVIVFFNGSRGALLIPILFAFFLWISNLIHYNSKEARLNKILVAGGIVILLVLFGDVIKTLLVHVTQSIGLKSRIITKMLTTNIFDLTGRDEIWAATWQAIKDNWLFGYGAYGDRPFVFQIHFVGYSHNIFLEMLCSFGVFGLGICAALIAKTVQMFLCKDRLWRELYIVFLAISCQLFLSMSFWYLAEFWIMIAILYKYYRVNRRKMICQKTEEM